MINIARSLATAVFYFVIACVIEELGKHAIKKAREKYMESTEEAKGV